MLVYGALLRLILVSAVLVVDRIFQVDAKAFRTATLLNSTSGGELLQKDCNSSSISTAFVRRDLELFAEEEEKARGVYQAEDDTILTKATIGMTFPGFSGSGYVNLRAQSMSSIEWPNVRVSTTSPSASINVNLVFRYSLEGTSPRPCELVVNREVMEEFVEFPPTDGWSDWQTLTVRRITLLGANKKNSIMLMSQAKGPNLDRMKINIVASDSDSDSPPPTTITEFQAEDNSVKTNKCDVSNTYEGFKGSGYMDCQDKSSWIQWNEINAEKAGIYLIGIRYASNNNAGAAWSNVSVRGSRAARIRLGNTGSWTNWKVKSLPVFLTRGTNEIRIQAQDQELGIASNVDLLELSPIDTNLQAIGSHEAEHYTSKTSSCVFKATRRGFRGNGYMDCGKSEAMLQWTNRVFANRAVFAFGVRYALADATGMARTCVMSVDGTSRRIVFDDTGSWTTWKEKSIRMSVGKGQKTIEISCPDKGPNIDLVRISPSDDDDAPDDNDEPRDKPSTYVPGQLSKSENGLRLSTGLTSRIIAKTGEKVKYKNGGTSSLKFHARPDGAAVFLHPDGKRYAYVSNSEVKEPGGGGVGAIMFDQSGEVVKYSMVLSNTRANCSGGKTPWNTWLSCEEFVDGQIFEVDPFGNEVFANGQSWQKTVLADGTDGEAYEAVACDNRIPSRPVFYYTIDYRRGELRRFKPDPAAMREALKTKDFTKVLTTKGEIDYLILNPNSPNGGTYEWTNDLKLAKESAAAHYQNCEGIEFDEKTATLHFDCKRERTLFSLDIDGRRYDRVQTHDYLRGHADQMRLLCVLEEEEAMLYFAEEGGRRGIHARDARGNFVTILEGFGTETTGIAFSPDQKHLYFSVQEPGVIFDITREDGYPFSAKPFHRLR